MNRRSGSWSLSDVDPSEGARLGKVLGADYLLYGTVDRIEVTEERKTIALTGESRTDVSASGAGPLLGARGGDSAGKVVVIAGAATMT